MIALRRIAIATLALLAAAAAVAAVLWAAALAGLAHPVVLATGAMQPSYAAGDLLVTTRVPTADLAEGDVVSVPSGGTLVPERIVAVEALAPGSWSLTTAADATERVSEHRVGAEAWAPTLRVPGIGAVAASVLEPKLGLPLLAAAGLLLAVVLFAKSPAAPPARRLV